MRSKLPWNRSRHFCPSQTFQNMNLSKIFFCKFFLHLFFWKILPCKNLVDKGFCFGSRQDGAEYFTLKYIITYYILRYTISYLYISIILSFVIVPLGLSSMKPLHEKIFFSQWLIKLSWVRLQWGIMSVTLTWTIPWSPPGCSWCGKPRRPHPPRSACNFSCPPCET